LPLLFLVGGDPVRLGLVASLNRPENNATGVTLVTSALGAKRVELLSEAIPGQSALALLRNPKNPDAEAHTAEVRSACDALRRRLQIHDVSASGELAALVQTISDAKAGGVVMQNDPFFDTHRQEIVSLCARHRLPAIFHVREYPDAGGLMSYGPSLTASYHELGLQASRVLERKATRDIPVIQSARFEFVINLRTAETLGLNLSPSLMSRVDAVVE
jgi:putative ABC transport system substrate-binding protein